jgi:hypothetical protein
MGDIGPDIRIDCPHRPPGNQLSGLIDTPREQSEIGTDARRPVPQVLVTMESREALGASKASLGLGRAPLGQKVRGEIEERVRSSAFASCGLVRLGRLGLQRR